MRIEPINNMKMIVISIYCKRNLVHYIIYFYEQNGRFPTRHDFNTSPFYPSARVYDDHFESCQAFEKLIKLLQDPNSRYHAKYCNGLHFD